MRAESLTHGEPHAHDPPLSAAAPATSRAAPATSRAALAGALGACADTSGSANPTKTITVTASPKRA
jgi:hypothetical protein